MSNKLIHLLGMFPEHIMARLVKGVKFGSRYHRADDLKQVEAELHGG